MTTELATFNHTALVAPSRRSVLPSPDDWRTMIQMAEEFSKSGLMPPSVTTPAAALLIIAKGVEIGLPPVYSLSAISVIKGKPSISAEAMASLIQNAHGGNAIIVDVTTPERCTVLYQRREWDKPRQFTFTREMAKAAGLTGENWTKYPDAMLRARCISAVGRMAFQDVIAGMYVPEELEEPQAYQNAHQSAQEAHTAILGTESPTDAPATVDALLHASWTELESIREEHPKIAEGKSSSRTAEAIGALRNAFADEEDASEQAISDVARLLSHDPEATVDSLTVAQSTAIRTAAGTLKANSDLRGAVLARVGVPF